MGGVLIVAASLNVCPTGWFHGINFHLYGSLVFPVLCQLLLPRGCACFWRHGKRSNHSLISMLKHGDSSLEIRMVLCQNSFVNCISFREASVKLTIPIQSTAFPRIRLDNVFSPTWKNLRMTNNHAQISYKHTNVLFQVSPSSSASSSSAAAAAAASTSQQH